jgi:uncharacterized membrane protein
MRPLLLSAVFVFLVLAAAGTARASLTVCNQTGNQISVAYATGNDSVTSYHVSGWWNVDDGQCRTLTYEEIPIWTYVHAEDSNRQWPVHGDGVYCVRNERFSYDSTDDSEDPSCGGDYRSAPFVLVNERDGSATYTFGPAEEPTPTPAPANSPLKICSDLKNRLSLAVMFGEKTPKTSGWWHVDGGGCQVLDFKEGDAIDAFVAFRAEVTKDNLEWAPSGTPRYYCADETNEFDAPVISGKPCSHPLSLSAFYTPKDADIDDKSDTQHLVYWFHRKDFRFVPPGQTQFNDGVTLFNKKNYAAALRDFDAAITQYAKWADRFAFRSQTEFDLGNYAAALRDARSAVRLGTAANSVFLAEPEWATGDVKAAAADYVKAAGGKQGLDPGYVVSAIFALRTLGETASASNLLSECYKHCVKTAVMPLVKYLGGDISARELETEMQTYSGYADATIGYDLFLRKQTAAAKPYMQRAIAKAWAGLEPVPPPVLRKALGRIP